MLWHGIVSGKRRSEAPPPVVRRSAGGTRQRLSPEVEALARGEIDTLPSKRRRPQIDDPRTVALVPGVANRDARLVAGHRLRHLQQATEGPDSEALAEGLAEAVRLGLWRGLSVAGFEALCEDLLELPIEQARVLAEQGAERLGVPLVRASEETIAVWFRTEAALLQLGCDQGRVRCTGDGDHERLHVSLPLERAPLCLKEVGWKLAPLIPGDANGTRERGAPRSTPPRGHRRPTVRDVSPRTRPSAPASSKGD